MELVEIALDLFGAPGIGDFFFGRVRTVKLNEVALAKEVLLRNGFTSKDLEDAKIILRTGGGKGGEDTIEISATCCDPKEITIQRTLEYFTK